jgi:hypothetical protein
MILMLCHSASRLLREADRVMWNRSYCPCFHRSNVGSMTRFMCIPCKYRDVTNVHLRIPTPYCVVDNKTACDTPACNQRPIHPPPDIPCARVLLRGGQISARCSRGPDLNPAKPALQRHYRFRERFGHRNRSGTVVPLPMGTSPGYC